jgi:CheY-like chemotaxis protein
MGDATAVHAGSVPATTGRPGSTPSDRSDPSGSEIGGRIRQRVETRLAVVERHAHRLFDRALTPEELAEATATGRALAVLFGRIDLAAIARLARELVDLFSGAGPGDPATAVRVAATCDDLRALVDSAIAQQSARADRSETLVVIGPPSETLDGLCWVAANRGYSVVPVDGAFPGEGIDPVAVVVAGAGRSSSADDALLLAVKEWRPVPVVALHDDADGPAIRGLAGRADTVLSAGVSANEVVDEVTRLVAAHALVPSAVLCGVGPDSSVADRLVSHGFSVTEVRDADGVLDVVERDGGLVVFGPRVDEDDVASAAAAIRAVPTLRPVPLVWLGDGEGRYWTDRFDVWATERFDDAVATRMASRLRRRAGEVAEVAAAANSILGWTAAQVLIDRTLVAAHRSGRYLALASIRLDRLVPPERLASLEEVLGSEFRRNDILGRRGDRQLFVALEGVPREVAINRLGSLMARLELGAGAVRVGVALFPSDGRAAVELVAAAEKAADLSAENGGPAVVATTWRPDSEEVDALVADADPVVSGLVADLLGDAGLRTRICRTGPETLAALTAEAPGSIPRLLLVDLDVPGIDGFRLLRELRAAGLLSQVKVMLMMARFSEVDLRVALDIGAADVIRKPFSGTLLVHRVRLLLGEGP